MHASALIYICIFIPVHILVVTCSHGFVTIDSLYSAMETFIGLKFYRSNVGERYIFYAIAGAGLHFLQLATWTSIPPWAYGFALPGVIDWIIHTPQWFIIRDKTLRVVIYRVKFVLGSAIAYVMNAVFLHALDMQAGITPTEMINAFSDISLIGIVNITRSLAFAGFYNYVSSYIRMDAGAKTNVEMKYLVIHRRYTRLFEYESLLWLHATIRNADGGLRKLIFRVFRGIDNTLSTLCAVYTFYSAVPYAIFLIIGVNITYPRRLLPLLLYPVTPTAAVLAVTIPFDWIAICKRLATRIRIPDDRRMGWHLLWYGLWLLSLQPAHLCFLLTVRLLFANMHQRVEINIIENYAPIII